MAILQICTDASLKRFDNRVFTCSGAVCMNNGQERYIISPDSTNQRGELIAVYVGIKLAHDIMKGNPGVYDQIHIYSDSAFAVNGLREWMAGWIRKSIDGILYGSNGKPVKNQELFIMIITYCAVYKLPVKMLAQLGHINVQRQNQFDKASSYFSRVNGYIPKDLVSIQNHNNLVDTNTRNILLSINPDDYPVINTNTDQKKMCRYIIPENYSLYIS